MKFIIDDADIEKVREIWDLYPCDGVTTNPSLLAKSGRNPYEVLTELREIVGKDGELHVQVVSKDAYERLKTYYTSLDKRASADKIIFDMSASQPAFIDLFTKEFKALTEIGNSFTIRHHETNKIEIPDLNYYDYFFNRCLSLIALAVEYLQ